MGKRTFDFAVSVIGLVALSPLLLVIAIAVRITSPGPAVFRQSRLGLAGKPFTVYKFRSMVSGAHRQGAKVTAGGDTRITPLGRFLRRTKLDELPQLWNVLRGDMSFVGPRPEVPEFAELFPDRYETILSVRPGITHRGTLAFRDEERILAAVTDPRGFYVDRVMPHKLDLYTEHLDDGLIDDIVTICRTVTPWKGSPAVTASDLVEVPLVANVPAFAEDDAVAAAPVRRDTLRVARAAEGASTVAS